MRRTRSQGCASREIIRERLKDSDYRCAEPPKRRIGEHATLGRKSAGFKAKKTRGEVKSLRGRVDPPEITLSAHAADVPSLLTTDMHFRTVLAGITLCRQIAATGQYQADWNGSALARGSLTDIQAMSFSKSKENLR